MPYEVRRKGNRYEVVNAASGEVHARTTSKRKAEKQVRVLRGIEKGWTPTDEHGTFTRTINGKRVKLRVTGGSRGTTKQ